MASVFTLRRMSEGWKANPPYENWSPHSASLAKYAQNMLTAPERALPSDTSLPVWLTDRENALRNDPYMRDTNAVVAYRLLPIFEVHASAWNTIQRLPAGQHPEKHSPTRAYLRSWRSAVDPSDGHVVDQVMQLLGML